MPHNTYIANRVCSLSGDALTEGLPKLIEQNAQRQADRLIHAKTNDPLLTYVIAWFRALSDCRNSVFTGHLTRQDEKR